MAAKKNEAAEPGPKKGGAMKLVIVVIVLLALLGGGGFAAWKFFLQPKQEDAAHGNSSHAEAVPVESQAPAEHAAAEPDGGKEAVPMEVVKFEPFVVNLADPMGRRYLKITMEVEVTAGAAAALEAVLPKTKDALLLLLSSKLYSEIGSMDQKLELKNEIIERLNQIVGKGKVKNVYFTEFVIQ